jgi:hypothetical protein
MAGLGRFGGRIVMMCRRISVANRRLDRMDVRGLRTFGWAPAVGGLRSLPGIAWPAMLIFRRIHHDDSGIDGHRIINLDGFGHRTLNLRRRPRGIRHWRAGWLGWHRRSYR